MKQASTSTIASGGCHSTRTSVPRSTLATPICATYVAFSLAHPQVVNAITHNAQTGGRPGGSCTAALFLKAFVEGIEEKDGKPASLRWAHIDIAGTMEATRPSPYQYKGMTGRPAR